MIDLSSILKLAKQRNATVELRSVIFDGKSAITVNQMDWVAGVPCLQPALSSPVVVPVDALLAHLAKSRHLVVMPDHLTNGQGLVTPFNKPKRWLDETPLSMLPKLPEGKAVSFDLSLDALDRTVLAAGEHDIRQHLNSVMFDLTRGVMVGTDGHRLHVYRNRVPAVYPFKHIKGVRQGVDVEVIVNREPLRWIVGSATANAKVTIWNAVPKQVKGKPVKLPEVLLQTDDAFVWVRKAIDGKFPDYQRVLPAVNGCPLSVQLDPVKFADAVAAMGRVQKIASGGKLKAVVVDFAKGVVGTDKDAGMPVAMKLALRGAAIDLAELDDTLWMAVNSAYMQDLADCVTDKALWYPNFTACATSALLVVDGDFEGVVMPTRNFEPVKVEPARSPEDDHQAAMAENVARKAHEVAQSAPIAETAPDSLEVAQNEPVEPEIEPIEPCPAAVAALVAQLLGDAQESAKKEPKKAKNRAVKAVKNEVATPVAA